MEDFPPGKIETWREKSGKNAESKPNNWKS